MPLSSRTRAILVCAGILWIAGLAYFSLRRTLPHAAAGTAAHRIEHIAAFGVLGLLWLVLCQDQIQQFLVVFAILCLAVGLEYGQHLVFRHVVFEWWDARDNIVGLLLAWLLIRATRPKLV